MVTTQIIKFHMSLTHEVSLCLTNQALRHQDVWRSRSIDQSFLDLGARWRWVASFTSLLLHPQYPMDRRQGGPQSQSGWYGEVKICGPTRMQPRPLSCPAHSRSYTNYTTVTLESNVFHAFKKKKWQNNKTLAENHPEGHNSNNIYKYYKKKV
jgi:hypothetical protein